MLGSAPPVGPGSLTFPSGLDGAPALCRCAVRYWQRHTSFGFVPYRSVDSPTAFPVAQIFLIPCRNFLLFDSSARIQQKMRLFFFGPVRAPSLKTHEERTCLWLPSCSA